MITQAAAVFAGLGLLGLASCTTPLGEASQPPPMPPAWAQQARTAYNNKQVLLFVSRDPGWQAWLNAIVASQRADDAVVGASRYDTPVWTIIQTITAAQDAYRLATSFYLPPFTVTSSCLNLYPEANGAVQLDNGLTVRYGFFQTKTTDFNNGSSCLASIGVVDEIDSSRGMPIAIADSSRAIDWSQSFSRYLTWHQPYWELSTGATLSLSDLLRLIEK
jgi:hypothetical protein